MRFPCRPLVAMLLSLGPASTLCAQAPVILGEKKDLKFETLHVARNQSVHGYDSFWFQITNLSKSAAHTVRITVPRYKSGLAISRSIDLKPGATERLRLWYPPLPLRGWEIEVKIDGRAQQFNFGTGYATDRGLQQWSQRNLQLLGSFAANPMIRDEKSVAKAKNAAPNRELEYRQMDLDKFSKNIVWRTGIELRADSKDPPRKADILWDTRWLLYSMYDGVIFYATDWKRLSEAERQAVLQYVECGGSLLIHGSWTAPEHWKRFQNKVGQMQGYHVGFGECLVMPDINHNKWQPAEWRYLAESWAMSAAPFHVHRTAGVAHATFPVVDNVDIPVRGLFGLMVGFVILIGPVNLYFLSKKKQRIWLLGTVPAISTVTCLAVLGYMLATEGSGTHSRVEGVTFLDENTGRAATVGWIGIYATTAPSEGLRFTEDTELTPQWDIGRYRQQSRTIDYTDAQHLKTGWVTPRVPAHFLARKSEERKERLVVGKNAQGKLTASNPFPEVVRSLHVATADGKIFTALNLAVGAAGAILENTGFTCSPAAKSKLRELFWTNWISGGDTLAKTPEFFLQPGCYVATFDASPFLEDGLTTADRRQARAVVFGVMKEPVNEN